MLKKGMLKKGMLKKKKSTFGYKRVNLYKIEQVKLLIILKFFFKGNSQIINKSKNLEISYEQYRDLKEMGLKE